MEDTSTQTPKKAEERKDTRFERRLRTRKQQILNELLYRFFAERSKLEYPNGLEADALFVKYRDLWLIECNNHNRTRSPLKLVYEAFAQQVEAYLAQEETNMKTSEQINKIDKFHHWFRRRHVWKTMPVKAIIFWIKGLGNSEKVLSLWKAYYLKNIAV